MQVSLTLFIISTNTPRTVPIPIDSRPFLLATPPSITPNRPSNSLAHAPLRTRAFCTAQLQRGGLARRYDGFCRSLTTVHYTLITVFHTRQVSGRQLLIRSLICLRFRLCSRAGLRARPLRRRPQNAARSTGLPSAGRSLRRQLVELKKHISFNLILKRLRYIRYIINLITKVYIFN